MPTKIPNFNVVDTHGNEITDENIIGGWYVIYFYPKDMTSGCTLEAQNFETARKKFTALNCQIFGVSKDSCASHIKFSEKEKLGFTLLSDPSGKMCEAFGVWKEKAMYGRKYMGIERSTFLVDPKGYVVAQWNNVKVSGHVDEVFNTLKSIAAHI
jgi:peroxiredoxin Q/BCP